MRRELAAPLSTWILSLLNLLEGWTTSYPPCHSLRLRNIIMIPQLSQRHPLSLGSGPICPFSPCCWASLLGCEHVPKPSWLIAFSSREMWNLPPRPGPPHLPGDCPTCPHNQPCHPVCIALSWLPRITLGHVAPQPCTSHRFTGRPSSPVELCPSSQLVSQGSSARLALLLCPPSFLVPL